MTILQFRGTETMSDNDEPDRIPSKDRVTDWDIIVLVISILSHVIDVGFDINLAYQYYNTQNLLYFILTVGCILLPSCVNTVFSFKMDLQDGLKNIRMPLFMYVIILFLQLAPILRYVNSLTYALKSRKAEKNKNFTEQREYYDKMLKEDSDVALLRVMECFLEAAPQQILQITILLVSYGRLNTRGDTTLAIIHQILSIGSSFISMAWSMASYHRSLRFVLETKENISKMGTAMQFLWHLSVTVSRILSISVLASIYPEYTIAMISLHWLLMTIWLLSTESTKFCNQQRIYDILFFAIFGLVYTFTHVNLSEGRTRFKYVFFYVICFLENFIATTVWILEASYDLRSRYYFLPIIVVNMLSFIFGIMFMIIYYKVCHPTRGLKNKKNKSSNSIRVNISEQTESFEQTDDL